MQDEDKTKEQLIIELHELREQVVESEKAKTERKRAEEALRESEERYRQVVENANEAIVVAQDGMFRFVNCVASEIFGYPEGELLSRPFVDFIHRDDRSMVMDRHLRRLRGERLPTRYPFRLVGKDGGTRWVQIGAALIEWEGRAATLNLLTDITERKRMEEKVREQVDFLQTLFDTIPNPIFHKDANGRYTGCNRAFLEFTGRPVEEILGKTVYDMGPKDIADKYEEKDRELFEHPGKQQYEWKVHNTLGEVREVIFDKATLLNAHAAVSGLIGVISDITERKRVEAMLASVNRQNELLLDSVGEGIYGLDLEGRTTFANPKAVSLVGYNLEEMIGRSQHDLIHHSRADGSPYRRQECPIYAAFKDGQVHHVDTEVFWRKEGTSFPVAYTSTPIHDENGELQGAVVVFSDITERKQAEEEKIQMEQRLQKLEKAESLGRMAGSIAHHFNNKLGVVMGNLELALYDLPQESDVRVSIVESMKASRQAAEVSRLMLAYLGQTIGRKEPLNLVEIIRETLPVLGASTSKHVHLKTDFPPRRPIILGDSAHIKQIITNLVSNAAEAIDQNAGDITVAIQVTATAEIQGLRFFPLDWEQKAEQYVCLSVSDTGCGMDVATQEKVFDPFFSTKFTGRGLGLSVLLGLVRAHDGAITVMSGPGRGAMFQVFFPLHTLDAVPPPKEEPLTSRPVEKGGLVLVVDDDPMVRDMAQSMLKRMAYEVIAACDGHEAVEMFRARKDEINLVLLDLSMPGMDGWETLAQLRSLRPDIPVVLASGYDEAHVMQGDHPHLPHVFLHKPYLKGELEAAIDRALKKPVSTG
jgi:PAS domain S-box-containing protein